MTYRVKNVKGRTAIQFDIGNWAGDATKGLKSDVEGCILVGWEVGTLKGQPAVLNSRKAFGVLMSFIGNNSFKLTIKEAICK
jgi:hypothetical protein